MVVAKGQIQADKSYSYTCGYCSGRGFMLDSRKGDEPCSHCYNGDYEQITMYLRTAQGERYYSLLKAALKISGKAIHDKALELKAIENKITPPILGYLSYHFQINFKALGEWLEETHVLPAGAIQRVYERRYEYEGRRVKFQVGHALKMGHEWYEKTFGEKSDTWNYLVDK